MKGGIFFRGFVRKSSQYVPSVVHEVIVPRSQEDIIIKTEWRSREDVLWSLPRRGGRIMAAPVEAGVPHGSFISTLSSAALRLLPLDALHTTKGGKRS